MKHASSRDFFTYWDRQRGRELAPYRRSIEPGAIRHVLADSFVLAYGGTSGTSFRTAGTRLCALFGHDLTGESFIGLWDGESRDAIADLLSAAALELRPTVAGAIAANDRGAFNLELLLLPFATQPHMPHRLTGLLAPLAAFAPGHVVQRGLTLTSWRHLEGIEEPKPREARLIQRWALGPGLTLYAGRDHNA